MKSQLNIDLADLQSSQRIVFALEPADLRERKVRPDLLGVGILAMMCASLVMSWATYRAVLWLVG